MHGGIVFNGNFPLFAIENHSAVQAFCPHRIQLTILARCVGTEPPSFFWMKDPKNKNKKIQSVKKQKLTPSIRSFTKALCQRTVEYSSQTEMRE